MDTAQYLSVNYFDADALEWERLSDGSARMTLSEAQWSLVHELDLNMFYNDGTGYIDLGLDNIFDFDKQGRLIASTDRTWVSINGQPVAYYHLTTEEDGTVTGRVPAFLNGTRVNLLLVFDAVNGEDYVAGAITDYVDGETETVSKELVEIKEGDVLEFIADYYSYSGEYEDTYYLGEPLTVGSRLTIANTPVGKGEVRLMYRFTDIYNQEYWAPVLVY